MVQAISQNLLGIGIYTPAQAARFARIQTRLMVRWIHGNKSGSPALRAQLPDDPDKLVTFLDMIQAMAIRAIRLAEDIPLEKIRQFIEHAEQRNLKYPFAREHTTYLFDGEIVVRIDEDIIELTGKYNSQTLIPPIAEPYLKDLHFDPTSGLANRYVAMTRDDRSVVLDPTIRFGEPTVEPCRYSVDTLLEAVQAEGSLEGAARAYEVETADIEIAQRYDDWLKPPVA